MRLTAKTIKTIKKKNNPSKFPAGYAYILDNQEVARMRSKILTTSLEVIDNEAVSSFRIKSHYNPTAFTEKGLYMLATKHTVKRTKKLIDDKEDKN